MMELTVYADVLFATNFLMDLIVLFLTVQLSRTELNLVRLTLADCIMALYGTVSFIPEMSFLVSFLGRSLVGMIATWILAPKGGWLGFLKTRVILSLVTTVMGGVVYSLVVGTGLGQNLRAITVNGTMYFLLDMPLLLAGILFSYGLLILFRRSCVRNFSRDKLLIPLTISIGSEKVTLTALADTGCELTAPMTGEGVLLVSEKILKGITPKNSFWLSIHTAAGDDRIPAFYPDKAECHSRQYQLEEVPLVGIVQGRLSKDELYSGIMNPKILGETKKSGGRCDENEVSTVLTVLAKNFTQLAKDTSQRCILYRRQRKPSCSSGKGRGGAVVGAIGYPGGTGAGKKNPDREKFAVGCLHSPEV